jgi:hypothetical protein
MGIRADRAGDKQIAISSACERARKAVVVDRYRTRTTSRAGIAAGPSRSCRPTRRNLPRRCCRVGNIVQAPLFTELDGDGVRSVPELVAFPVGQVDGCGGR